MSGTQDLNFAAQTSDDDVLQGQSGIDQTLSDSAQVAENLGAEEKSEEKEEENSKKTLTPSQKMDELIRGTSAANMKKEIEKLRKEAAKYRNSSKSETEQKLLLQAKAQEIQRELDALKKENRTLCVIQKLDKAGCIKSELVAKDIPDNLNTAEDLDNFIKAYKEKNKFLFNAPKPNVGSSFKTSGVKNLTPAQRMDAYIRAALGR